MPEQSPDHGQMTIIEVQAIDPSPFQRRQHFEEDKLKGLAASIQRDGLIEPIVVRPMAGGGVVADTCLAFNRKCWSFDMDDRPDTRPEIIKSIYQQKHKRC